MKFLVPVDFSPAAQNAAGYAIALARITGSSIHFIHVIEPLSARTDFLTVRRKELYESSLRTLKEWLNGLRHRQEVECTHEIRIGGIRDEIVKISRRYEVTMIIMGTTGATRLKKILWGSTTASLMENSPVPVLAIPPEMPWTPPRVIVYATDYNNSDTSDLIELAAMADRFRAKIITVHIAAPDEQSEYTEALNNYFAGLVETKLPYNDISCHVIYQANTETGLHWFLQQHKANIIALATRKRNILQKLFHPGLTKSLVSESRIPVLAFHVKHLEGVSGDFFSL